MQNNENNGTAMLMLGLFAGAAIGASLALMYAPKTGAAMRDDCKRAYRETADRVGKMSAEVKRYGQNLRRETDAALSSITSAGKREAREVTGAAGEVGEAARNTWRPASA